MMGESKAIWRLALEDILGINPSPDTRRRIPKMSAAELRSRAITALRMHRLWGTGIIKVESTSIKHLICPTDVVRAEIGPEGRWILTQHWDGALKLWNPSMTEPPLATIMAPAFEGTIAQDPIPPNMGLLLTASEEGQFAFTVDRHTSPSPEQVPSMAEERPRVWLLCPHVFALIMPSKMKLYQIPQFDLDEGLTPLKQAPSPFQVYDIDEAVDMASFHWRSPSCEHCHDGRYHTTDFHSALTICRVLPNPYDKDGEVLQHKMSSKFAQGLSRMLWHETSGRWDMPPPKMRFHSCVHSSRAPDHPGYLRLEISEKVDVTRIATIVTPLDQSFVDDLAWDESTGKICAVIPVQLDGEHHIKIVTIDLLE
ncbi:hypothetical protein HWV62_41882 [Athelia sp. TMB]|nr:hypothetical protein HWV62_41882 [Athelia sp. TMB]